jgi:hypothetical protein
MSWSNECVDEPADLSECVEDEPPGKLAKVRPEGLDEHDATVRPSRPASTAAAAALRVDCRHRDRIADLL